MDSKNVVSELNLEAKPAELTTEVVKVVKAFGINPEALKNGKGKVIPSRVNTSVQALQQTYMLLHGQFIDSPKESLLRALSGSIIHTTGFLEVSKESDDGKSIAVYCPVECLTAYARLACAGNVVKAPKVSGEVESEEVELDITF